MEGGYHDRIDHRNCCRIMPMASAGKEKNASPRRSPLEASCIIRSNILVLAGYWTTYITLCLPERYTLRHSGNSAITTMSQN